MLNKSCCQKSIINYRRMSSTGLLGTWEVTRLIPSEDKLSFKGIRFHLDPNGDVTWYIREELQQIPLFNCTIYDTNAPLYPYSYSQYYPSSPCESFWVRFGEYQGQIIEFQIDQGKPKDTIIFRAENLYTLYCKRITDEVPEGKYETSFSLLPALEEGYFSDLILLSSDKKEFHVHSLILNIIGEGIDWTSEHHPLSNLPEDVLGCILHFMYTECLPESLHNEDLVRKVLNIANQHSFLSRLSTVCQKYLSNILLGKRIMELVNEIHYSLDKVIEDIKPRKRKEEDVMEGPYHLCYMIKNYLRDAGVGLIKMVELCDLYHTKKSELTKQEQYAIIQYGKSRFFVLVTQMTQFLEIWRKSYGFMHPDQRNEVATFLVPEVSQILDMLTWFLETLDGSLEKIIEILEMEKMNKHRSFSGNPCLRYCYLKEVKFLMSISETVKWCYESLKQKRRSFLEMSDAEKVRSVSLNIQEIVKEMPLVLMVHLEELKRYQDRILTWRNFKFFFQTCTSKISNFVNLIASQRHVIQGLVSIVTKILDRQSFNQSLQNLGLLEGSSDPSEYDSSESDPDRSNGMFGKQQKYTPEINLVELLSVPPKSDQSILSKNLLEQLRNSTNTDMEFEIVNSTEADSVDECRETCVIRAHRVVVASRCDWFRRALLSGMKEDIDKKIVIHETNPDTFKILLEYLYSGKLSPSSITHEQLVELVVLSDRFEVDSLKQSSEMALEATITTENAIYLLSLADSYNAKTLKVNCLDFIAEHRELTETDLFYELQSDLKAVILDQIWTKLYTDSVKHKKSSLRHSRRAYTEDADVDTIFSRMNICSDTEVDRSRLESCITQIRQVIGQDASREQLIQVILAADYDLCRAINYYYAKNN